MPVGAALSACVALVIVYYAIEQRRLLVDGLEKRARVHADVLSSSAKLAHDFDSPDAFIETSKLLAGGDAALVATAAVKPDGSVFASSGQRALPAGVVTPSIAGTTAIMRDHLLLVAHRPSERPVAVVVALDTQEVDVAYRRELPMAVMSAAIVLLGGIVASLFLGRMARQNARERWLKTGQSELADKTRGMQDVTELCRSVVGHVTRYLGAQVGVIYTTSDGGASFTLSASYAFTQRKRLTASIAPGEGLVGQAVLEKEPIVVAEVPADYLPVSSGLGESTPRSVAVFPLIYDNAVKGVLEIGSLERIDDTKLAFLRSVSEGVAIAISAAQAHSKLQLLLATTQEQSRELQQRQQLLHTANQDLETQATALKQSEERLKEQSAQLQTANQQLEEKTLYLENQKRTVSEQNDKLVVAQAALEAKAKDLEAASQYKSEFLANMSHELRTPLNSLLILARTFVDNREKNLTEDQVKSATIIHKSGQDLLTLINDILDLSKVEAGRLDIELARTETRAITAELQELFEPIAAQKGVAFRVELEAEVPAFIETDSQRLQQILKNLLSNALKFTSQGSVCLRAHLATPPDGAANTGSSIAFSVIDTGIGIPESRQQAIFEAFQQADGSTSRTYGGTGLGLTISRKLAQLLGGVVRVQSKVGVGSTFTLVLPVTSSKRNEAAVDAPRTPVPAPAAPTPVAVTAAAAPTAPPLHVAPSSLVPDDRRNVRPGDRSFLVVEDDPDFAGLLVQLIQKRGYKCVTAADGPSAIGLAQELRPCGIVLDMGLPTLSGLEVLEQLKHDPATRHIPIHVISGREGVEASLKRGAVGCLKKPASADDLEAALAKVEAAAGRDISQVLVAANNGNGDALANLLGNSATHVKVVHTGAEVVTALGESGYQCLVYDPPLPDMSAVELIEKLQQEAVELPPVIIHSDDPAEIVAADGLSKGRSRVVKVAETRERVLDEVVLFLHSVETSLSPEQRAVLRLLHDPDKVLAGRTVLLVDDDVRNLFAMSKVLSDRGMKVVMADNGQLALDRLAKSPDIDLVLMDIMMPVMDGYETMRRIRAQDRWRDLPIVALTAKSMAEDRAKCLAAGANDYLTKPVDVEKLFSVLRIWLFEAAA